MPYILIVDDDRDFTQAMTTILEEAGYEVAAKPDPESGLMAIRSRCPDLVILDVMFPDDGAAGFELARKVRTRFKTLPLLMVTGVNQKFPYGFSNKDIDDHWLPVSDFIEKPVDFDDLCDRIAKLIDHPKTQSQS